MITPEDLTTHAVKIDFDSYDKIQNKLLQAQGIINVAWEAHSDVCHEDLGACLWAVSEMLGDVLKLLENEPL
jgi:hypothetical protein